jgi:tetratricopeptide (TPR) repeat protein
MDKHLRKDPSKEFFWQLLHEIYVRTGRTEALNIEAVFEKDRSMADKLSILVDICIWAADYENANAALALVLKTGRMGNAEMNQMGRIALLERRYDEVIRVQEQRLTKEPNSTELRFILARAYIFAGRWKDAEKCLAEVIRIALAELHEKKDELMMSMIQRNAPPPKAKLALDTASRFLQLMIGIRDQPNQRFRLLVYGPKMFDEDDSTMEFKLYPDVVVPSGTTAEDLLHWSRTKFEDLFPPKKEIISSFTSGNMIQSTSVFRPEELAGDEPGSFSFTCTHTSYEEERGEDRPKTPGGSIPSRNIGFKDPILTGDTISLLPEKLMYPPPDPTASQMFDHRFRLQSAAALGRLLEDTGEMIQLRDKKISEQMSKPHVFAGAIPEDKGESYEGRLALADYYLANNNHSAAKHHLYIAMESHPNEAAIQHRLLEALFAKLEYTEAFPIAEKIAKTDPKDSTIWYYIGIIRGQMGREHHTMAEEAFIKSVKIDKKALMPLVFLGNYYVSRGKAKEAKKWIDKAFKMDSTDFYTMLVKVDFLLLNEKYEDAEKLARKLTDKHSRRPGAWEKLADVYISKKRWEDARGAAQKALELDSRFHSALAAIGEVHFEQGNLEEAEKNLRKALEAYPTEEKFWYILSLTLDKLGKHDESVDAMRNAWKYGYYKAEQVD